ncbi:MAG TPA: recombinase family protein [Polyangiaceae bacterium]|nr:recombinase family protein [Polyangiaceae bacterium]
MNNIIATTKIRTHHTERLAGVYVRQSSPYQVRVNTASTQVQYDLCARAVSFGWPRERVTTYDGDLAVRGSVPSERQDFAQLVLDVGLGRIGIIVAFDATRLARNNTDWHRLLDMCSICDTLVADLDGVYDLSLYNDRLLLGLKGTLSEAEHHLIRARMVAGMEKKAESGELRKRLPVGLEYDDEGHVQLHPDETIRHAVELVFATFRELGSAHQVYRHLQSQNLMLPVRRYSWSKVEWQAPSYLAVLYILRNPRYAGAYVYGRTRPVRTVDADGKIRVGRTMVAPSEWKVKIKDHHPGYITWEEFETNQGKLRGNTLMHPTGEASAVLRNGRGLLQGLIRCGVCGRRMRANYPTVGDSVRYDCAKKSDCVEGQGVCQSFGGTRLERAVADEFLKAVQPASMEIAIAALDEMEKTADSVLRQFGDQLEEARYQAVRAQRQYDAVEPENRKVARTLETVWNERLAKVTEIEERIERYRHRQPAPLAAIERERLLQLGVDVRAIWDAPTTTMRDKKQLVRAVFEAVFVRVDRETCKACLTLIWQGGNTTEVKVQMRRRGDPLVTHDAAVVDDVRRMAEHLSDKQIARALTARGVRTANGLAFNVARVAAFRKRHGIAACCREPKGADSTMYTACEVARELGVSMPTVLRWLKEGFLVGDQVAPFAPWQIRLPDSVRLRTAPKAPEGWLPIRRAARVLGVSGRTILHWIQCGEVEAMMGGSGRQRGIRVNMASCSKTNQRELFERVTS